MPALVQLRRHTAAVAQSSLKLLRTGGSIRTSEYSKKCESCSSRVPNTQTIFCNKCGMAYFCSIVNPREKWYVHKLSYSQHWRDFWSLQYATQSSSYVVKAYVLNLMLSIHDCPLSLPGKQVSRDQRLCHASPFGRWRHVQTIFPNGPRSYFGLMNAIPNCLTIRKNEQLRILILRIHNTIVNTESEIDETRRHTHRPRGAFATSNIGKEFSRQSLWSRDSILTGREGDSNYCA